MGIREKQKRKKVIDYLKFLKAIKKRGKLN
jgi:hypothetical protein